MSEAHQCPYGKNLTAEEEDALNWLSQMLGDMTKTCSPAHTRRALFAHTAVAKLLKKADYLHDLAHVHEAEIEQAETMVLGMAGFPRQVNPEEDFN